MDILSAAPALEWANDGTLRASLVDGNGSIDLELVAVVDEIIQVDFGASVLLRTRSMIYLITTDDFAAAADWRDRACVDA